VSTPREQLGKRLRDLRLRVGLSGDRLAALAGLSQSKVSRVETGRSLPSVAELEAWAATTKASNDELSELAALVEQIATAAVSWHTLHRLGLSAKQQAIAELETKVTSIQVFQPVVEPGLLLIPESSTTWANSLNLSSPRPPYVFR
jgi:transcriptional regulator with XRE-family HTH domain